MNLPDRLSLIVITDRDLPAGRGLVETVEAALRGGAPSVQLRAKADSGREMTELARELRRVTRAVGALLWVNDRVDVALAVGADGAHLGEDDLPLAAARGIVPPGFLLGRSVDSVERARDAQREGADYLGVGCVYATASKPDAGDPVGLARVAEIAAAVRIPVVGIGGIGVENAAEVVRAGAAGVAVIREVMHARDPGVRVRELLRAAKGQGASDPSQASS